MDVVAVGCHLPVMNDLTGVKIWRQCFATLPWQFYYAGGPTILPLPLLLLLLMLLMLPQVTVTKAVVTAAVYMHAITFSEGHT